MKTCAEYEESISAYLDGELSGDGQEELMEHMASCPVCQRYFDDLVQDDPRRSGHTRGLFPADYGAGTEHPARPAPAQEGGPFSPLEAVDGISRLLRLGSVGGGFPPTVGKRPVWPAAVHCFLYSGGRNGKYACRS